MKRYRWASTIAACAMLAACSDSGGARETVGQTLSADTIVPIPPGLLTPCGVKVWSGSQTDLLTADAVASCSGDSAGVPRTLPAYSDRYLTNLYSMMGQILPPGLSGILVADWITARGTATNCDRQNGASNEKVTIVPIRNAQSMTLQSGDPRLALKTDADADLRTASVNLCVAQQLRSRTPGASANEALTFSETEQRQLLEVIRERAQIAMLQYSLLGVVFSTNANIDSPTPNPQARTPILADWATLNQATLAAMSNDFASAVQLHGIVTQELGSLLSRSRSARTAMGAHGTSLGERYWGQGSWSQRTGALMFGGDPLAQRLAATELGSSLAPLDAQPGTFTGIDWPTAEKAPFVTADIVEPQVMQLLAHARRFNALDLLLASGATSCQPFDLTATAQRIYSSVERGIRTADCYNASTPGDCTTAEVAPAIDQFATFLLWRKYRIRPEHATTLARYLSDAAAPRATGASCQIDSSDSFAGALDVAGAPADPNAATITTYSDGSLPRLHFDPSARLAGRPLASTAGAFTRLAPLRMPLPTDADPLVDVGALGFNGRCTIPSHPVGGPDVGICDANQGQAAEAKRTMGALSAESAVRELVAATLAYRANIGMTANADYFRRAPAVLDGLGANVGSTTVGVASRVQLTQMTNILNQPLGKTLTSVGGARVTATLDDSGSDASIWKPCATTPSACKLHAVQGKYAGNLATHPEFSFASVTSGTTTKTNLSAILGPSSASVIISPVGVGTLRQAVFESVPVAGDGVYTLVLEATDNGATKYKLLAANVRIAPSDANNGQFFADDGGLGGWTARQFQVSSSNPMEPAYDGFGLPNHWVPPLTAELLGGSPSETSIDRYLGLASATSDEASKAVESAVTALIEQQRDKAILGAAIAKSQLALQQDRDGLCGPSNTTCDTSFTTAWLRLLPRPYHLDVSCDPAITDAKVDPKCALQNSVKQTLSTFWDAKIDVASVVWAHINDPTAPAFQEYAGGALQEALIEQWRALIAPADRIRVVAATLDAAEAQILAAKLAFSNQKSEADYACSPQAMTVAHQAGNSSSQSFGFSLSEGGPGFSLGIGDSDSQGPVMAQEERCRQLMDKLTPDTAALAAGVMQSMSAMESAMSGFREAEAQIVLTSAKIRGLLANAKMADARAKLEAQIVADTQTTALPLYHRYHDYDMWRARALLENARRYAVAARRAIEARYVVDMTRMASKEAFVEGPSVWADEVYGYDLSLPSAVGLSVGARRRQMASIRTRSKTTSAIFRASSEASPSRGRPLFLIATWT